MKLVARQIRAARLPKNQVQTWWEAHLLNDPSETIGSGRSPAEAIGHLVLRHVRSGRTVAVDSVELRYRLKFKKSLPRD